MNMKEQVREYQKLSKDSLGSQSDELCDLYYELEESFRPLLKAAVYRYRWVGNTDDLKQVARISFYQGLVQYDCDSPVFFEYYIKRKVFGDMRSYARKMGRDRERELLWMDGGESDSDSGILNTLTNREEIDESINWQSILDCGI
ncbi:hypothetical protein BHU72_15115 [Desulfuribacillus stibiiarsenatis]|uniref:RNA polymerase sigma-70 region 2 domain-containing protein n=1 Tax=Desulfuribacillus stibiiarsenatis TaxID=1390249 RepID=A0A1E5L6F7_9FIRM|nr:hypothetical protein [Desulfuribacillus stibiiarsenatis]OEH85553.1 hypothetical protein BHU72_15115 [Desulfuribacillus stibiiarsenatis]